MARNRKPRAEPAAAQKPIAGDALLASLRRHGVHTFFANPGTDFPPIVEGFARAKVSGAKVPRAVLVPHENLAVAMAHGAYLMTGAPQAVMVHVNVGTANTINLLANAARDRVPLLLMAGRSPIMEEGAFGARSRPIHWAQEMFDQAGMVREFVKWDYELRNPTQAAAVVARAVEAAMTEPRGPVYLTLPREPLAAPFEAESSAMMRAIPSAAYPDPTLIARLADWLMEAERPLLIASSLGRAPEEAEVLARLAEHFALPVVAHTPRFLCLPTDHAMHHGFDPGPFLDDADLIVVIESDVPWLPSVRAPPATTRVANIGEDPAFLRYPMRSFPSQLSITANAGAALRALEVALAENLPRHQARLEKRAAWARARAASHRAKAEARISPDAPHITPEYLSRCIGEIAGADGLVFNEYQLRLDHCAAARRQLFRSEPGGRARLERGCGAGRQARRARPLRGGDHRRRRLHLRQPDRVPLVRRGA
jgi:acetolactate synthase-1/2/3 large subunit